MGVLIPENLGIWGLISALISVLLLFLLNKPEAGVCRGVSIVVFFFEIVMPAFYMHYVIQAFRGSSMLDTQSSAGIATRTIERRDLVMAGAMLCAGLLVFVLRKIVDSEDG